MFRSRNLPFFPDAALSGEKIASALQVDGSVRIGVVMAGLKASNEEGFLGQRVASGITNRIFASRGSFTHHRVFDSLVLHVFALLNWWRSCACLFLLLCCCYYKPFSYCFLFDCGRQIGWIVVVSKFSSLD